MATTTTGTDIATLLHDYWSKWGVQYTVKVPSRFTLPPYNEVKMFLTHDVCGETIELRDASVFPRLYDIAKAFSVCPFCEMEAERIDSLWAY